MLDWIFGSKIKQNEADKLPPYEESRDIAEKGSLDKRRWLASRKGLQPEILYYFATDKESSVRLAVAGNITTPLQADKILSQDKDDDVRTELALKISRLLPGLDTSRAGKVSDMVLEIIYILAEDKVARVRSIVAQEVKSLSNMPEKLIEQLAWDVEALVSMPILEYSPLLSDRHLLEIIRSGIDGGALSAIARRNQLSSEVSSSVAHENVESSMVELLKNKTASISEKSFKAISGRAQSSTEILDSLIERDDITLSTIRRIASFIGNAVLSKILDRHKDKPDFNDKTVRELRQKVSDRILKGEADTKGIPGEEARERAEKLFGDDKLNDKSITKAIDDGERMFVIHSFALLTGISWTSVRDILTSKTAKSITALTWKAGISAEKSVYIQSKFCSVSKSSLVTPDENGEYAFSEDDMEWYLDSFL